jgi:hypothetical protein
MVSTDRKKELKAQYLQMKPDMGVFVIRCDNTRKCHVQTARDFRAVINSNRAKLAGGFHPIQELQQEWTKLGTSHFVIEVLEKMDYDQDESKTDYQEELDLLKIIWEEKLENENWYLYHKRI